MYRDNSLIPKEAIRMAALGALVKRDRSYGDVAGEVRKFAARIVGPSLDLLGTSIELLKLEGLIQGVAVNKAVAKANETEKWDGQARTTTYAFPGMRTLRIHDGGYRFA